MNTKTKRILDERTTYKLSTNDTYNRLYREELAALERKIARYGGTKYRLTTPERNMLKALRMMPYMNSLGDWARLHALETVL